MKILSLVSIKGGVGKTIASVNIAGCLASLYPKKQIILADLDPQGNASMYLGYTAKNIEQGVTDIFDGNFDIEDVICDTKVPNLKIIPSEISLKNIELRIELGEIKKLSPNLIFKEKFDKYKEINDDCIVIIDTHPDFNIFTNNALICSDRILCPIEPSDFSIHGFNLLLNNTNFLREKLNKKLRVLGIFKNIWEKNNTKAVKEINSDLKDNNYLFKSVINSSINIEESKKENLPLIFSSYKNSSVSKNYLKLAKEIIAKWDKFAR